MVFFCLLMYSFLNKILFVCQYSYNYWCTFDSGLFISHLYYVHIYSSLCFVFTDDVEKQQFFFKCTLAFKCSIPMKDNQQIISWLRYVFFLYLLSYLFCLLFCWFIYFVYFLVFFSFSIFQYHLFHVHRLGFEAFFCFFFSLSCLPTLKRLLSAILVRPSRPISHDAMRTLSV